MMAVTTLPGVYMWHEDVWGCGPPVFRTLFRRRSFSLAIVFEPAWLEAIKPVLDDFEFARFHGWKRYLDRFIPVLVEEPCEVAFGLLAKYSCVHFKGRLFRTNTESNCCTIPVNVRCTSRTLACCQSIGRLEQLTTRASSSAETSCRDGWVEGRGDASL
jgi:hypothetical protein